MMRARLQILFFKYIHDLFFSRTLGSWLRDAPQPWSTRTCPRFGTARHVAQLESGDMSPHSKLVRLCKMPRS